MHCKIKRQFLIQGFDLMRVSCTWSYNNKRESLRKWAKRNFHNIRVPSLYKSEAAFIAKSIWCQRHQLSHIHSYSYGCVIADVFLNNFHFYKYVKNRNALKTWPRSRSRSAFIFTLFAKPHKNNCCVIIHYYIHLRPRPTSNGVDTW